MTTSTHFWLRLVLYLVSGFALGSVVTMSVKERLKARIDQGKSFGSGLRRTFLVITGERVRQQVSKIGVLLFGVLIGYALRDVVLLRRTETLSNVVVRQRYDDHTYQFVFVRTGQPFNAKFCPESQVRLEPGEVFATINYEQKLGCKSVVGSNLGFIR